jgi:hypothetical protein
MLSPSVDLSPSLVYQEQTHMQQSIDALSSKSQWMPASDMLSSPAHSTDAGEASFVPGVSHSPSSDLQRRVSHSGGRNQSNRQSWDMLDTYQTALAPGAATISISPPYTAWTSDLGISPPSALQEHAPHSGLPFTSNHSTNCNMPWDGSDFVPYDMQNDNPGSSQSTGAPSSTQVDAYLSVSEGMLILWAVRVL